MNASHPQRQGHGEEEPTLARPATSSLANVADPARRCKEAVAGLSESSPGSIRPAGPVREECACHHAIHPVVSRAGVNLREDAGVDMSGNVAQRLKPTWIRHLTVVVGCVVSLITPFDLDTVAQA